MTTTTITQVVAPVLLTNTLTTTLYTVPASTKTILKEAILCNTDTSARQVTLYFGGGSAAGNTILAAYSIAAGQTVFLSLSTVLIAADTIKGGADTTNKVSITVSGVQVT
jgi:hypothetical protein